MGLPTLRLTACNRVPARPGGRFVVYWMSAVRRVGWNFALQYAASRAAELGRPLIVVETLACGNRWASHRHHQFVLQGMVDNAACLAGTAVRYYPFVECEPGAAARLLAALAAESCLLVADDFPIASVARPLAALVAESPVRVEKVDGNGLLPMRAPEREFPTAHGFRRFLQQHLRDHLLDAPVADPLAGQRLPAGAAIPKAIERRWPATALVQADELIEESCVNCEVPAADISGGSVAGRAALDTFLRRKLSRYADDRNHPDADGTSRLSPYLHFGHISVHEILDALARRERWTPGRIADQATGKAEGWWGMSAPAEAFLDELVTWRELGFNLCSRRDDYDQYASLPAWAQATLAKHARDRRPNVYTFAEFETARTHDPLWNAAQMQLLREGRIHNYLRMLWGKNILHWTDSPQQALEVMIELNNKYALDGQDPNSYSGIFWALGRYDRPWGPEREVFGTIRYMTSDSTARKLRVRDYLRKHAP